MSKQLMSTTVLSYLRADGDMGVMEDFLHIHREFKEDCDQTLTI